MTKETRPGGRLVRSHTIFQLILVAGAVLVAAPVGYAQDVEHSAEVEHATHAEELLYRHYVSFFGGLATYTDVGETGGAMGVSYAYKLSHRWAAGLKLEYVTSSIERDIVGLLGVTVEPVERLELSVAFGAEQVSADVIDEEEIHTEREWEGLLRLGVAYGFPLRPGVYLAPEFNTDITSSRVTLVYGLVFSVGL